MSENQSKDANMPTSRQILKHLTAYLYRDISLAELVAWAESVLIEPDIPAAEDADLIMDVLTYLAAADSRGFPLTWDVLTDFVARLGGHMRVVVEVA